MKSVVVHYQEIALKGKNRPWFIARLVRNLRQATADLGVARCACSMGRIEVVLGDDVRLGGGPRSRLPRVFGIANFAQAGRAPRSTSTRSPTRILARPRRPREPRTFRVSARRADKRFPLTSPQIEREVGGRIKEARGWTVDLDDPEFTIHVEALTDDAFYFFGKEHGAGGMPVGVSGRVACLLSGGIDSPVAAWRLMRRGCRVALRPLSQLPDPVARVAGEGARAGAAADARSSCTRGCSWSRSARSSSRSCSPSRRRCASSSTGG